jgi:predicted metalloprotease with PDZ domain
MRNLYSKHAKIGSGITEEIFCNELESIAGKSVKDIWVQHAHTATNYLLLLKKAIKGTSFQLQKVNSDNYIQNRLGIYLQNETGKIVFIAPNSPGALAGLNYNDEILAINNIKLMGNGNEWASYFSDKLILTIKKDGKIKDISISQSAMEFFTRYELTIKD